MDNMFKENLFEKIRNEDVVFWTGAGTSFYAGFPSGNNLAQIIYDNLTIPEKEIIGAVKPLDEMAEEFIRFRNGSRNELIKLLKKQFIYFKPKSNLWHKKLSQIPHIKTIITTNYDQMFERNFEDLGQQICTSNQIPLIDKSKVEIFKVHGDLAYPESIIISKSDYNNFFKNYTENNILWNIIKERISTNCVLFLGYNLEDSNVNVIFDRILENLGDFKKESYFVAPSNLIPQHKIIHLQKKGLHYIDMDAETFINELKKDIDENIINDFENNKVSATTFRDYSGNFNLAPKIKSQGTSFKLESFDEPNGPVEKKLNFNISALDKEFIQNFRDITSGKKIGEIEITKDKILDLDLWVGPLKMPKSSNFEKLKFATSPQIVSDVDLRFDDGFEVCDIPIKIFIGNGMAEIHAKFKVLKAIVKININDLNKKAYFTFEHDDKCGKISDELEWANFFKRIASGLNFTIYPKNGNPISEKFISLPEALNEALFFVEFFQNLKKIETHFKVRFKDINFKSINGALLETSDKIVMAISREKQLQKWNGEAQAICKLSKDHILDLKEHNGKTESIIGIEEKVPENINFFEHNFEIGYKVVEFLNVLVLNIDELKEGKSQKVKFKSATNEINIFYLKNSIK